MQPKTVLEVGAGYTTMFLLQALKDNHQELSAFAAVNLEDKCTVSAFGGHKYLRMPLSLNLICLSLTRMD